MGTNTGIGIGIGIPFKNNALGGDKPYFPPELEARMIGVWDNYGKKNTDADRNIIKNKIPNAGGDLEILNSAYKLNSGFGEYKVDFTVYNNQNVLVSPNKLVSIAGREIISLLPYVELSKAIPSYKIKVIGLIGELSYWYRNQDGSESRIIITKDGIYQLPTCYNVENGQGSSVGFNGYSESSCTIEQIPEFEGALVTDGINDIVASIKTLEEWNIGDKGITIVSMIHQINTNTNNFITTNNIRTDNKVIGRNIVSNIEKTGIYGWYKENIQSDTINVINNILGDENDYTSHSSPSTNINPINNSKFYVQGYAVENGFSELSSIAHYWTFAVLGKATEDEINLIIAKYNLDRTLRPDILCNIERQGITNDNHADFNDKLIDYSGNGRDIQMYNLAWKGGSGVAAKQYETFKDWTSTSSSTSIITEIDEFTRIIESTTNGYWVSMIRRNSDFDKVHEPVNIILYQDDILLVHECKYKVGENVQTKALYDFLDSGTHTIELYTLDRFTDIPENAEIMSLGEWLNPRDGNGSIKYSLIPSCKGGILLDGITDFGKVIGMPIYKDYTLIVDRQIITNDASGGIVASKSESAGDVKQGAFIFEYLSANSISTWSYYKNNSLVANSDSNRNISYQSKYSYNGKSIEIGEGKDSDKLWIGTIRDNDKRFANIAIYSLMSFPYSMSKFLIERQLKKYKLGTLYPNMVEFRPIFPKDDRIESVSYYAGLVSAKVGSYYPITTNLGVGVKMVKPYKITALKMNGARGVYNNNGFNFNLDSKSPQKFTNPNIVVDTSIILFNPTINSNAIFEVGNEQNMTELIAKVRNHEIDGFIMYLSKLESKYILPNSWINKDTEVISYIYCLDNILQDDLHINIDGNSKYCLYADSSNNIAEFIIMDDNIFEEQYITNVLTANTIDIQLDQYIRYEDIVQPYPVLLRFNDENGNEVSWGGKFRVGSTITRIGSIADPESNLLNGLYSVSGLSLNGKAVTSITSIVEKQMVFKTTATWLLDNNEPNCILSPRLLRIPNSSYKILGYIPDISGNGNHGVIHNSAYIEGSGANEDGSYQFDGVNDHVTIPTVTGGGKQVLMKVNNNTINSMLYDQRSASTSPNSLYNDFAIYCTNSANNNQIAYQSRLVGKTYIDGILNTNITCEDLLGVLHNITITCDIVAPNNGVVPNIGRGGVLKDLYSKVALYDFMLFDNISTDDKIKELNEYVGIEAKIELPPYYWDAYGKTNLDEDKNYTANLGTVKDVIEVSQPAIFAENWYDGNPEPVLSSPIINQTDYSIEVKANKMDNNFTMMLDVECDTPLPAFKAKFSMVGTAISVDLKYYINGGSKIIDVFKSGGSTEPVILDIPASERSFIYGTNTDNYPNILIEILPADNGTSYGLTNTNFAYDKMSGYGGYNLSRFDKSWSSSSNTSIKVVQRNPYDITLKKLGGNSDWKFNNKELKVISNPVSVKFKSNKNIRVTCDYHYYPVGGNSEGTPLGITSKYLIANKDAIITISPISQENIDKYNIDVNRGYYLIYFQLSSTLAVNEEVTIEMLPLYPNGLVYDGVTDYSENANIPALDDFTAIMKRKWLKKQGCPLIKGSKVYEGGNRNALLFEWDKAYNFVFYKRTDIIEGELPDNISFITPTNYNGNVITRGSEQDTNGICIAGDGNAGFANMVFYKLILYPKTIPLLQINFLKNLMERDEIIDLDNPIFKK